MAQRNKSLKKLFPEESFIYESDSSKEPALDSGINFKSGKISSSILMQISFTPTVVLNSVQEDIRFN